MDLTEAEIIIILFALQEISPSRMQGRAFHKTVQTFSLIEKIKEYRREKIKCLSQLKKNP